MVEIIFTFESNNIIIQCNENQKILDICEKLSLKINVDINSLFFLYGGTILNLDKKLNEITKENKINILVYKYENEVCPKCGRILNDKVIDEIISSNNNVSFSLTGITGQIENIINNIINQKDINYINSQLNNINVIINNINLDLKKINNKLNQIKLNHNYFLKLNNLNEEKAKNILKNEITCIYNKQEDEINLLHDFNQNLIFKKTENSKSYIEGKNNINEGNIEIYVNNKKIKFDYKYKSEERGEIKVKFIFNKLLTTTCHMFRNCSSLKSIDLSSFNSTNVNDMWCMFYKCFSLESIDLSSLNTKNVNNMSFMFFNCSTLKSLDLSKFNTVNVYNMKSMFRGCSSLKSLNLSSFNTFNVNDMSYMFFNCSSLESLDLSSFNTSKVIFIDNILEGCQNLIKENIKISNFGKNILDNLN